MIGAWQRRFSIRTVEELLARPAAAEGSAAAAYLTRAGTLWVAEATVHVVDALRRIVLGKDFVDLDHCQEAWDARLLVAFPDSLDWTAVLVSGHPNNETRIYLPPGE